MAVLDKETDIYPSDLLDVSFHDVSDRNWWAVHAKPRQEKVLSRLLLQLNIPFYLPLVRRNLSIRGRRLVSFNPLFTGYVFVYVDEDERVVALKTNRIVSALPVADEQQFVEDLRHIRQLIASNAPVTIERKLTAGQAVRVKSGYLKGVEGTVLSRRGMTRLLIAVNFLQQGASVEIEDDLLESL